MGTTATRDLTKGREERLGQYVVTRHVLVSDGTPGATTLATENRGKVIRADVSSGTAYSKSGDTVTITPPASRTIEVALYS